MPKPRTLLGFEPQVFPDMSNQPEFGFAHLDPGGTSRQIIDHRFSVRV